MGPLLTFACSDQHISTPMREKEAEHPRAMREKDARDVEKRNAETHESRQETVLSQMRTSSEGSSEELLVGNRVSLPSAYTSALSARKDELPRDGRYGAHNSKERSPRGKKSATDFAALCIKIPRNPPRTRKSRGESAGSVAALRVAGSGACSPGNKRRRGPNTRGRRSR